MSQLKRAIHKLKKQGYSFSLTSTTTKSIPHEHKSHTFKRSLPLQSPCGCGGRHDFHGKKVGKNKQCTLEQCLECLVNRAKPSFQLAWFLLVLCDVKLRERG